MAYPGDYQASPTETKEREGPSERMFSPALSAGLWVGLISFPVGMWSGWELRGGFSGERVGKAMALSD